MRYVKQIVVSIKNCLQVETLWDSAAIAVRRKWSLAKVNGGVYPPSSASPIVPFIA